jgi:hypothetical protein
MVAHPVILNAGAHRFNHAGPFVAQQEGKALAPVDAFLDPPVGVTHPGGQNPDQDFMRAGIIDGKFFYA